MNGPELPLNNAVILGQKAKARPAQIKAYDNVDDRLEIATLLKHLSPNQRLAYFRWVCSQAIMPGTFCLHPAVAPSTVKLAEQARHCDRADERLTMDILQSTTHMLIDYSLDASKCLTELVRRVRGKS